MALITVRDAAFAYDGPVVVSGLIRGEPRRLPVRRGENGSGKSTLIKGLLLLRPVRQRPVR